MQGHSTGGRFYPAGPAECDCIKDVGYLFDHSVAKVSGLERDIGRSGSRELLRQVFPIGLRTRWSNGHELVDA